MEPTDTEKIIALVVAVPAVVLWFYGIRWVRRMMRKG